MNRRGPNRYNNRGGQNHHGDNQQFTPPAQQMHNRSQQPNSPRQFTPPTQQNRSQLQNSPREAIRSGPCVLCQSVTVLICQRCGDFYCSPTCQEKDWSQHRYICFEMPLLVRSSEKKVHGMPALNGYQNRELPPSVTAVNPVQNKQHQNRQNHQKPTPNESEKPLDRDLPASVTAAHPVHQKQHQNRQNTPRSTPNESGKPLDKTDAHKPADNIVKIDRVAFPKNNSNVLLTAFRCSNRVFLRSIEKEENEGYCDVIKAINTFGKEAGPLKSKPFKNAFAITDFNQDGLYYRVQVVSAKNDNEIKVLYYDFGNEETKKLSELKEISQECAELKQYIVQVTLKNVGFVSSSDKITQYLKTFEDMDAKIVYNEKEKPNCEIIIPGMEETLNESIGSYLKEISRESSSQTQQKQQQQQQKPQQQGQQQKDPPQSKTTSNSSSQVEQKQPQTAKNRPSPLSKPVMVAPFETSYFPEGAKNLKVVVMDNSFVGFIGCMLVEDEANLRNIQTYLCEYQDNGKAYKPRVEEYCLAKYEDCWYRAKVVHMLSTESFEVVFVDYLNESEVGVNDIRRYPMDLDYPCKTSMCMIEEVPTELSDKLAHHLKSKMDPGSGHIIDEVVGVDEENPNIIIVKMNQVNEWLNENLK